jgi:pyruvate dehydrogenase E2 component (dihydrolipoamide acetyltransferase)
VRKLAEQLGVSLESLAQSGPLTEEDVRAAAAVRGGARADQEPARRPEPHLPPLPTRGVRSRVALSGVRRTAAEHLTRTQAVPAVTVVEEASFDTLDLLQGLLGVGYIPFLIQAVVSALAEVPELNALFDERSQELVIYDTVDMAIAVHTDEGLAVPVLRDCAGKTLRELEARVQELGTLARARKLSVSDSMGGTFTITSPGDAGALLATPLLNVPQVAILGLHRPTKRPVVVDGELRVGLAAHVTLTHDHRVIDGLTACRFLRRVTERLSNPIKALEDGVFRPGAAPRAAAAEAPARQEGAAAPGGAEPPGGQLTGAPGAFARELLGLDPRKRRTRLEQYLDAELQRLMKRPRPPDRRATWKDLGLDSLVAVGLRNVLVHALDRSLPATLLFNRPTPAALANHLLAMLESEPPEAQADDPDAFLASLKGLPESQARALIAEKLAAGFGRP